MLVRLTAISLLAFLMLPGGASARPDGAVQISFPSSGSDQNPAFDPATGTIVFSHFDNGYNVGPAGLFLLDAATGSRTRVTPVEDQDNVNLPGSAWNQLLDRIVLASDRAGGDDLWRVAKDGSDFSRITNHQGAPAYIEPTWSPDGSYVVFEATHAGASDDGRIGEIWKVRVDGTGIAQLTGTAGLDDRQPNWSPAGDRILFQRRTLPASPFDIYTMDPVGGTLRNVTADPGSDNTDASFSPDGKTIVYSSDANGGVHLFVIPETGGTPLQLTSDAAFDGAPSFAPDGASIAFESHASDTAPAAIWTIAAPATAEFSASPRAGTPPLAVQFQDQSTGSPTSYAWDFGDAATSTQQNPLHTYSAPGRFTVSLSVNGGASVATKTDYILVASLPPDDLATAPGEDPNAAPSILAFDAMGAKNAATNIIAYGVSRYGANVATGDLDGSAPAEILTGPGPGPPFGPQVRAFRPDSTPLSGVNFYAYGTLRFGVLPDGADLDGTSAVEILVGAGHGAVFGPHVRAFRFGGGGVGAIARISFFAYGTLKFGVNSNHGNVSGDSHDEILTMPGPGVIFAPVVRGFRFPGTLQAIGNMNFQAFSNAKYGGRVAAADADGDGWDEILAAPGPSQSRNGDVRAFDYDDSAVVAKSSLDFQAFQTLYGAILATGDLDGDGLGEVAAGVGPDPAAPARVQGFDLVSPVAPLPWLDVTPYATAYGANPAPGALGF